MPTINKLIEAEIEKLRTAIEPYCCTDNQVEITLQKARLSLTTIAKAVQKETEEHYENLIENGMKLNQIMREQSLTNLDNLKNSLKKSV